MNELSQTFETTDIFTPAKPAIFTYVERSEINCQLVDALRTPGKQLIVYGFTGSGKTTLLRNKLDQIYERYISTSCTKGMKLDQIRRDAFDLYLYTMFLGAEFYFKSRNTTDIKLNFGEFKKYLDEKLDSNNIEIRNISHIFYTKIDSMMKEMD